MIKQTSCFWSRYLAQGIAAGLFTVVGLSAQAQEAFPTKAVKIIASFPPGQATDVGARLVANELAESWKQAVIVENQAGGLGVPAMQNLRRATADGYTLGVGTTGTMATNAYLMRELPYSPLEDYTVIAPLFTTPLVLLASPSAPFKTLDELLSQARAEADTITWAIPGLGSAQHVAGERVFQTAGVSLQRVPYKGSAPAVQDLIGGQVMFMTDSLSAAVPLIQAQRVVPLAITSAERVQQLPDVPTVAELGFPGFSAFGWAGIIAPAGLPQEITEKIAADMRRALSDPKVAEGFRQRSLEPDLRSSEEWRDFVGEQIEIVGKALKAANVPRQ